ncbi:hypothetical protein QAD02_006100 [Eretmocerus hayati]|uniref:Uncharacterized protein n=1 Tax=Eretmocerus hayati TaxID=131215 RepID=A0ACC2N0F4_9HYME|nr:hypothetical protein QAD02_006100 [Eretmocerus hayati]
MISEKFDESKYIDNIFYFPQAFTILRNMNKKVSPCDDFYEYACGNYKKDVDVSEHQSQINPRLEIFEHIMHQLRDGFEIGQQPVFPKSIQKLSLFYKNCKNEDLRNQNSVKELIEMIDQVGGWPIIRKSWDGSKFEWSKLTMELQDAGLFHNMFIKVFYEKSQEDKNKYIIRLDGYHTKIPANTLLKGIRNAHVQAYYDLMVALAIEFGADPEKAKLNFLKVLDFEIEFAQIQIEYEQRKASGLSSLQPITISDLQQNCHSKVKWLRYISKILMLPEFPHTSTEIHESSPGLACALLNLFDRTDERILANYAMWTLVYEYSSLLSSRIRNLYDRYLDKMWKGSAPIHPPIWMQCVQTAKRQMHLAAGSLYVSLYVNKHVNVKNNAKEIVDYIEKSIWNMFEKVEWMSPQTKSAAMSKLKSMKYLIGYPEEILDSGKLDDFYQSLDIHPTSYLKSEINLNRFYNKKKYDKLREVSSWSDKLDWTGAYGDSSNVNAYYNSRDNAFVVLAGILQGAYFDETNPKYMNFATIGSVIGHEMMHAFDNNGRRFDRNGNRFNWWDHKTEQEFSKRQQCFVNQYNALFPPGTFSANAMAAVGENIADSEGLRQAYLAYELWLTNHSQESKLEGLSDFSPKQMFWLSYANTHCAKLNSRVSQRLDSHAPGRLRVLLPLSNSAEFARDFGCGTNGLMTRGTKCSIWG